jgi:hypothetical protein
MALNHYSNLTASSRACTAQMHALGYSNETRCAFLKHGETVRPTVHTQRATHDVHDVQECDGACACNSRRAPGSMQPAQCIALHAATTSATVRTARWPTTVKGGGCFAHCRTPPPPASRMLNKVKESFIPLLYLVRRRAPHVRTSAHARTHACLVTLSHTHAFAHARVRVRIACTRAGCDARVLLRA